MANRLKIGLLIGYILDIYCAELCKGAIHAANDLGSDLVIVPGKYFNQENQDNQDIYSCYEYQYNALFSYVNENNIDVLIVCLGLIANCKTDEDRFGCDTFMKKFSKIPVVTVSYKIPGVPNIKFNNAFGMREGVRFLIENQKCKKIAMVTGPQKNEDAVERLDAYCYVLKEHDMEVDPNLIRYSNFTKNTESLVLELMQSNPGIDAIVFGNDNMAMGGYAAMEKLGLQVGKDIAFLGFDDFPDDIKLEPPLATVRADAPELGYEAVKFAMNYAESGVVEDISLDTKFIMRESVCVYDNTINSLDLFLGHTFAGGEDFVRLGENFYTYMVEQCLSKEQLDDIRPMYNKFWSTLKKIDNCDKVKSEDAAGLTKIFSQLIESELMNYVDVKKFTRVIDLINWYLYINCDDIESKLILQQNAMFCLSKLCNCLGVNAYNQKVDTKRVNHLTNLVSREMMAFENGSELNFSGILENLYLLNVKSSYLYLFKEPIINLPDDDFVPPSKIYLKAYQIGKDVYAVPKRRQAIGLNEVFSNKYIKDERTTNVVIALYSNEMQYGILVCDIPFECFDLCESISYQASTAIKLIYLLKEEKDSQKQLEESMTILRENNIELDTLSKIDELTCIYNRRGFYQAAEDLLGNYDEEDASTIVVYADTDNLKIINDRFGHDGGDFAIVSTANILQNAIPNDGIVGRIGGDEFVGLYLTKDPLEKDKLFERLKKCMDTCNKESGKSFKVSVSFGIAYFDFDLGMELKDLIEKADTELYIQKKQRKKEIAKNN
jgi:diguanylate cyclase (GGDEF)-like protein